MWHTGFNTDAETDTQLMWLARSNLASQFSAKEEKRLYALPLKPISSNDEFISILLLKGTEYTRIILEEKSTFK